MKSLCPYVATWVFAAILPQTQFVCAEEKVIPVDAVSILTGGGTVGESDAAPILLSDIEFEAYLILTARSGPSGLSETPTAEDWRQAKTRAVILRLLANQAGRLHEIASDEDKLALRAEIIANVGSAAALNRLAARIGTKRDAVDRWVESAALALGQLRFLKDQSLVSKGPTGRESRSKSDAAAPSRGDTLRKFRHFISRETADKELRERIVEIVEAYHIRVLR